MNVRVLHNGTNITSKVIKYNREHKICSGIGMIELEVDYTLSGSFDPWDTIKIYENGNLQATYYVSSMSEGQPNATILIDAQDNSKRLTDYFIKDSYLIDYPSYSRFWIEYFLDEVGISYTFSVGDYGVLLSNNTSLGLTSAYDQILQLLQMSGWYITFTASGKARIGKLSKDFASVRASIGDNTLTDIKVISSDRMLRNRVVVWGHGDPEHGRWVFADVYKRTPWDYDRRDKRTIVISNNNIRTVANAFLLANRALSEFSRLTVEKHLTVAGATGIFAGDIIRVRNKLFTGKGLVTTYGTSMSKEGLISNIILDERCPRLFGFYELGGFVYVGTFGSGVWRKHIDPAWSGGGSGLLGFAGGVISYSGWNDYSSGLMDSNVTDLHVNAGVLACVTSSGYMYYSIEDDTPWSGIPTSGLQVVYSGALVEDTVYSGLMARACIIDRDSNYLRYAVDTRSGINLGDFLMETDPLNPDNYTPFSYETYSGYLASSGILPSGVMRSWVLNVNPYSGSMISQHSVNVSGNYDWYVYDIENDGLNDYVEAMTVGSGELPYYYANGYYVDADQHIGSFFDDAMDDSVLHYNTIYTSLSYSGFPTPILQTPESRSASTSYSYNTEGPIYLSDFLPDGLAHAAWCENLSSTKYLKVTKFYYDSGTLTSTNYSKVSAGSVSLEDVISVTKVNDNVFRYYAISGFGRGGTDAQRQAPGVLKSYDFDTYTLTENVTTLLSNLVFPGNVISFTGSTVNIGQYSNDIKVVSGYMYYVRCVTNGSYGFDIWLYKIRLDTGGVTALKVFEAIGNGTSVGDTQYTKPSPKLYQTSLGIRILCPYLQKDFVAGAYPYTTRVNYTVRRFSYDTLEAAGADQLVYDWGAVYGPVNNNDSGIFSFHRQTDTFIAGNFNISRIYYRYAIGRETSSALIPADSTEVILDFWDNITVTHGLGMDSLSSYDRIYNIRGNVSTTTAIARKNDGSFTYVDVETGSPTDSINVDPTVTLTDHLSVVDSFNGDHFYRAVIDGDSQTISLNSINQVTRRVDIASSSDFEQMFGNFRISGIVGSTTRRRVTYVKPGSIIGRFPMYNLLQRNLDDFAVVKSGIFRERIDISNYTPIVTMDRRISSLETFYISTDGEVLESSHPAISGYNLGSNQESGSLFTLGLVADDFRYSDFEDVVESGSTRKLMVVYSGGLGAVDLFTLDNFSGVYQSPSGVMNRVEVSNFSFPDQYIFASVSGYTNISGDWGFYEKIPSGEFVDYSSGYPQSRTTIIRLDDRL